MATYKSIIAYDGTSFKGFQRQELNLPTVQGELEEALRHVGWQGRSILAAGRTDAGVHAKGQVIAFELAWGHEASRLTKALNAHLPRDVAVLDTQVAAPDFHPRFSALRRRYGYTLITLPVPDPLRERYTWRIWPEPNLEAMQAVAAALIDRRDFAAFGRAPIPGGHTVREVYFASWQRVDDALIFDIEADSFLHRMVRRLVAAMVEVGTGRLAFSQVQALLDNPSLRWQGAIAPARGLCLEAVTYQE
jgi:tRNA pseudouridine38-40 synthase